MLQRWHTMFDVIDKQGKNKQNMLPYSQHKNDTYLVLFPILNLDNYHLLFNNISPYIGQDFSTFLLSKFKSDRTSFHIRWCYMKRIYLLVKMKKQSVALSVVIIVSLTFNSPLLQWRQRLQKLLEHFHTLHCTYSECYT